MFMSMDEIEQDLSMMQLSDSFFPTGMFALSNGLEYVFLRKKIINRMDLQEIITTNIKQQVGPSDCVALSDAFNSIKNHDFNRILLADNMLFATKSVKEIRNASIRSGTQLIKCVAGFVDNDDILNQYYTQIYKDNAHGVFPVAYAVCCNALKIGKEKSMAMILYGYVGSIVGAALRLGLIQHFESQKIIHDIKPILSQTVKEYSQKSIFEMWQFSPQMDIIHMSHEKIDSKMFIT